MNRESENTFLLDTIGYRLVDALVTLYIENLKTVKKVHRFPTWTVPLSVFDSTPDHVTEYEY